MEISWIQCEQVQFIFSPAAQLNSPPFLFCIGASVSIAITRKQFQPLIVDQGAWEKRQRKKMTNMCPPREQQYKLHHKQETFMLDWSNLMFSYPKKKFCKSWEDS